MKKLFLATSLVLMLFISYAPLASAAGGTFFGPIVPNGTNGQPDCNCLSVQAPSGQMIPSAPDWGCIMQTVQNTVNFSITLGMIIAILYIVYSGFLFVMSAGNPSSREAAKTRLTNVVIGFVVVLAAWLVVDFVMKRLYGESGEWGPWNAILAEDGKPHCLQVAKPPTPLAGVVGQAPPGPVPAGTGTGYAGTTGCPSCVALAPLGIRCKSSNSCSLDALVAPRLVMLNNSYSGMIVTEAYPPTYPDHTNQCHKNGTCVDADIPNTNNVSNVVAFMKAAKAAGFRPIFETESCSLRDKVRAEGYEAFCKSDNGYSLITGDHFSVYP